MHDDNEDRHHVDQTPITMPKGVAQAVFDIAVGSMDFGSGFLCEEEVEALRAMAVVLGVDPINATPINDRCKFAPHELYPGSQFCRYCHLQEARWNEHATPAASEPTSAHDTTTTAGDRGDKGSV